MKKLVSLLLCLLLLCGCSKLDEKPQKVVEHSKKLVGIWQMTTWQPDGEQPQDLTDQEIVFTYFDDFSGNQTIGGEEAYVCTYNYDGDILTTTMSYTDETFAIKRDRIAFEGETMTLYSYDDQATYTLVRIGMPTTKTTATTTTTGE